MSNGFCKFKFDCLCTFFVLFRRDNMGEEANEERAQQIYEKSLKIEQQFGDVLTAVLEDETLSDVYDHLCEIIDREQSLDYVWIPSKEKL